MPVIARHTILNMYQQIISITGPVFLLILLGFAVSKFKVEIHEKTIGFLLTHIGSPCLIFHTLATTNIQLNILAEIFFSAISVIFISSILAITVIKIFKDEFSPYFSCLIHPNSANLALPLSILTYGEIGLVYAIPYYVVVAISQNTFGYLTILGSFRFLYMLYHPIFILSLLGLSILIFEIKLPSVLINSTNYLGKLVIPLSLILLGYSLSNLKIKNFTKGLFYSIARFFIGFLSALLIIFFGDIEGPKAGVIMIMSTMPVGLLNYIFTVQVDKDTTSVAGLVVISTVLTLIMLPFLLNLLLHFYN